MVIHWRSLRQERCACRPSQTTTLPTRTDILVEVSNGGGGGGELRSIRSSRFAVHSDIEGLTSNRISTPLVPTVCTAPSELGHEHGGGGEGGEDGLTLQEHAF
jgi:hypothetical protein